MKKNIFAVILMLLFFVSCGKEKTAADFSTEINLAMNEKNIEKAMTLINQMEEQFGIKSAENHLFNLAGLQKQNNDTQNAVSIYERVAQHTNNLELKKKCLFMAGYSYANEFDPPQKEKAIKILTECMELTEKIEDDYFFQSIKSELDNIKSGNPMPTFLNSK